MSKSLVLALTACLFLSLTGPAAAEDVAQATLDKAVKAMGGEAKVAKLKGVTLKTKATIQEGDVQIMFTGDWSLHGFDRYRVEGTAVTGGMSNSGMLVLDGDQGWVKSNDKVMDAPKEVIAVTKDAFYAPRSVQLLTALKDKPFALTPLGEIKVNDKPALGIKISQKDRRDLDLYFDKETGLPVKAEIRVTEPNNIEATYEYFFSDYKEFDGVKHFTKFVFKRDGKQVFEMEVNDLKPQDSFDDSTFAKP